MVFKIKISNCNANSLTSLRSYIAALSIETPQNPEIREDILYVDLNQNYKQEEHEPVITISANDYDAILKPRFL